MKNKILVIVLVLLLLIIGSVVGLHCYFSNNVIFKDDNNQVNKNKTDETNDKKTDDFILESKQENLDKLKFSDLSYYKNGKEYIGVITITNDTKKNLRMKMESYWGVRKFMLWIL